VALVGDPFRYILRNGAGQGDREATDAPRSRARHRPQGRSLVRKFMPDRQLRLKLRVSADRLAQGVRVEGLL